VLGLVGLGDVVGDVGGKRRLAHGRSARENDQVGWLQPAHLLVEVLEAGRDAGKPTVALVGARRHVHGIRQSPREGLEALAIPACFGHGIERLFCPLDQVPG
jgi:hypothetical protein